MSFGPLPSSSDNCRLQATFLPFDAYARVCLIAAASHLLPALSYYWILGALLAFTSASGLSFLSRSSKAQHAFVFLGT